jgi:hypothetical protein
MSETTAPLGTLDAAIETLLDALTGLSVVDRLEMSNNAALPRQPGQGGIFYELRSTSNKPRERRQVGRARVEDRLVVVLFWRVNPHTQNVSRRAALTKEKVIRDALTGQAWNDAQAIRVTYLRSPRRGVAGEFYRIEQEFGVVAMRSLGGVV